MDPAYPQGFSVNPTPQHWEIGKGIPITWCLPQELGVLPNPVPIASSFRRLLVPRMAMDTLEKIPLIEI